MDDPNGARQTDPLRHAECLSYDDTKPFLEHTKSRSTCHGESWPEDSPGGEYIGVGAKGILTGDRPLHYFSSTLIDCILCTYTFTKDFTQVLYHCHSSCCLKYCFSLIFYLFVIYLKTLSIAEII